jgi:tetratricopeptide (TPR) repeat protein
VRRFEILGDRHFQLIANYNRGEIAYHLGRVDQAKQIHLGVLETARAIDHTTMEAEALAHLGLEELHAGRLDVAGDCLRQALRINLRRNQRLQIATQLSRLGAVLSHADRPADGATLIGASLRMIERLQASPDWYQQARDRDALEACSSRIGIPATSQALDRGRELEVEEVIALALASAA